MILQTGVMLLIIQKNNGALFMLSFSIVVIHEENGKS